MKKATIKIIGSSCSLEDAENTNTKKKFTDINEMVMYAKTRGIEITNPGVLSSAHLKILNS